MRTARTFSFPKASTASAQESAESKPPERRITAREKPTRVTSDLMNRTRIWRARSVLRLRLISVTGKDPVQFVLDQRGSFVTQQRQTGTGAAQLIQVQFCIRNGLFVIGTVRNFLAVRIKGSGTAPEV